MSQQQQQGPSQPPAGRGNFSSTVGPLQSRDYYGFYSNSGFDMLSALAKVASRKNPTINLGPVDLSSAFVVSDALLEDHPIIYVSSNFETLTGYVARDIIGKNCRFLQSPNGVVTKGERRRFVDDGVVYQIKRSLEEFQECQFVNINYKKSGEPFVNLVTIVPVSMDDTGYISHFVGFQIDIMKQSSSILRRLEDDSYVIDFNNHTIRNIPDSIVDNYRDRAVVSADPLPSEEIFLYFDEHYRGMPSIDSNISLVPLPPTSSGLRANASPGVSNLQVSPSPYSEFSSLLPPGTTDPSTLVPSIFSTSFDDADLIKDDSEISTGGFQVEAPAVNLDDIDTLNEIPGLTHILSSRGIILFMSPIFTREVLEYEPSELVGRNLSEFCHTGDNTSLMRELQGSEIGKKVSAMYRFRRKHSGFVWIEVLGHKYGIDNRKKTKCFVLSGRVRQTGVLPHGALSNTEQAQGSLTNEQVQSMDFWAKLSTYGLFLYIVPSSAFLFESAHEVLYTQSLLDYVTDGTRDAVQRGLEALAQRRTTTGSVDPITVRAMLHTRHLPVWIQLFPGASGSSSTNDQQQDYVDQSPCSFVFMKMSTLEPESGVSSRSAVYPLSALSLDIFSPLRMSQSAGLQFELNQLKEGNRQLSGAIENLRQGGSAH